MLSFNCIPDVLCLLVFCGSSSRCRVFYLQYVIVVFSCHTHFFTLVLFLYEICVLVFAVFVVVLLACVRTCVRACVCVNVYVLWLLLLFAACALL